MTAYSFGARWVGIVAMRDSPALVPEPLHKMAERLRRRAVSRQVRVGKEASLPASTMLQRLPGIRTRYLLAGNPARAAECLTVERALRAGENPRLRPWLQRELIESPETRPRQRPNKARPRRSQAASRTERQRSTTDVRETGWSTSYPQAPESPWLPHMPSALTAALEACGVALDSGAEQWVRWALVHRSYLYESIPDGQLTAGALELLGMLGRSWMRLGMLEHVRGARGDFVSNDHVSKVLAQDAQARSAISAWLLAAGGGNFGRGEKTLVDAGRSRSAEAVAMQLVGALSLTAGTPAPALALLRAADFEAREPDPDWVQLVRAAAKAEPEFTRSESGPDHQKVFTVVVSAGGKSAGGSAPSVKVARAAALRAWVHEHARHAIPSPRLAGKASASPRPYANASPAHRSTVKWAARAFEADAPGLFAQALTHRSWTYENKAVVAAARQRDYGVLATEGSEVLTTLVRHHYAVKTLSDTAAIPDGEVIAPAVTDDRVAELFDTFGVAEGVLRSRGMALSREVKSDVVQALAGAAWRAAPWQLADRQPVEVDAWVKSFVPRRDPTTTVQEYGATHRIRFAYQFQSRGEDHEREYRSRVTLEDDTTVGLVGGWFSGKTPAKHSASSRLLDVLSPEGPVHLTELESEMVRACVLAELRAVSPEEPSAHRDLLAGRMGLDSLAAGEYSEYLKWAAVRSRALRGEQPAVLDRITRYYTAALIELRRERIRRSVVPLLPSRSRGDDGLPDLGAWLSSQAPARLALVEDLLGAVVWQTDPVDAAIVFVQRQAAVIATASGASVESTVTIDGPHTTLTVRLAGRDIGSAISPVVDAVEAVVSGASWVRESETVAMTLPVRPDTTDQIGVAAIEALASSWEDPWVDEVRHALAELLGVSESAMGGVDPDRLAGAESALLDSLSR